MSGPLRPWNNLPDMTSLPNGVADFLNWVQTALNTVVGNVSITLPSVLVTTQSYPGAVQIAWNEIGGATQYSVYETATNNPPQGLPIATIASNYGARSNSYLRTGLNDTTQRFYWVMALNGSVRGQLSIGVPGKALAAAAAWSAVSDSAVNNNGVGGGAGGGGALNPGQRNRADKWGPNG